MFKWLPEIQTIPEGAEGIRIDLSDSVISGMGVEANSSALLC